MAGLRCCVCPPPQKAVLAGALGRGGFLVGDGLSIADVAVGCQLVQLELVAGLPDAARWPKVAAFFEQMTARPSFEPTRVICKKIVKRQFDLSA